MNRFKVTLLSLLVVTACSSPPEDGKAPAVTEYSYFFGGRIIPGDGSPAIEEATMIVENGNIQQVGQKNELRAPEGAGRIDLAGMTVIPAMININAHPGLSNGQSFGAANYKRESVTNDLNRYAYYGISTVASMGTDMGDVAFQIRDEQRQGTTGGAKLLTGGRGITVRGGYPAALLGEIPLQVATPAEAREAVTGLVAQKVDFVTIWVDDDMTGVPKMGPDIFTAVIDEAHKNNLKVMANVFYLADAKALVNAGVDGLVQSIRDREVDDELISMMKQKNTIYSPALTGTEARFIYADKPNWLGEQTMREVYPAQLAGYLADAVVVNKFKRMGNLSQLRQQYSNATKNLKKMADAGVRIAFGTGSGSQDTYPGYFEHRELGLMVAAGMSPMDTIKAATSVAAGAIGATDAGVVAAGKAASFIVLSANPLEDMAATQQVVYIYTNGKELDRRPLIPEITSIDVPRVTDEDRRVDREAQAKAAAEAREAARDHFGKYTLGTSQRVRGLSVPTPTGSRSTPFSGSPSKMTVTMPGASAADLRLFYTSVLAKTAWQAQGACFQRVSPVSQKNNVLCMEPAANQIVLTLTEQ